MEVLARAMIQQIKLWFSPFQVQVVKETLCFSLVFKQRWFIEL